MGYMARHYETKIDSQGRLVVPSHDELPRGHGDGVHAHGDVHERHGDLSTENVRHSDQNAVKCTKNA